MAKVGLYPFCQLSSISQKKRADFCYLMYSNIWFIIRNGHRSRIIWNPRNIEGIEKRGIIYGISHEKEMDLIEWAQVGKKVWERKKSLMLHQKFLRCEQTLYQVEAGYPLVNRKNNSHLSGNYGSSLPAIYRENRAVGSPQKSFMGVMDQRWNFLQILSDDHEFWKNPWNKSFECILGCSYNNFLNKFRFNVFTP